MLTMKKIAEKSGVSIATVSRYINESGYVKKETQRKIQAVIDKYNYSPNFMAKSLSKQSSYTIAVICPDMENPFFPELVSTIEEVARKKGYSLTIIQQTNIHDETFWNNFRNRYLEGYILMSLDISMNTLQYLKSLNIPFVKIDRAVYDDERLSVGVDNFNGAKLAVNHLAEIGCKHICHISGPKSIYTATERLMGYYEAIIENQLKPIVFEGDFTPEGGRRQTQKLLEEHPYVDGVFYANDLMALGSFREFEKQGYNLPEDVAIIGFDDIYFNDLVNPRLSSIRQPVKKLSKIATEILINLIEGKEENSHIEPLLDVTLKKRESTLNYKRKS